MLVFEKRVAEPICHSQLTLGYAPDGAHDMLDTRSSTIAAWISTASRIVDGIVVWGKLALE